MAGDLGFGGGLRGLWAACKFGCGSDGVQVHVLVEWAVGWGSVGIPKSACSHGLLHVVAMRKLSLNLLLVASLTSQVGSFLTLVWSIFIISWATFGQ